jgi:hypothetical protein
MSVKIGSATDYGDLMNQLDTFLTGTGMALTPSFVGTGNGTIDALGGSAGVAEIITVTFTSATAFGVVGSVSGSLGTGVVGTPFTSTKANLTITAGGTAFVATDAFTFAVAPPWLSKRRSSGVEMIWSAPGNGGLDQILVGVKAFSNVGADYYNWRLGGFQAFDSGAVFNQQVGYVGGPSQAGPSPVLQLWNSTIPYWFFANGRRVIVVAKISTVYCCMYLGLLNSYMAPGTFPYPLVVGGSISFDINAEPAEGGSSSQWRWSNTSDNSYCFAKPYFSSLNSDNRSTLRLRLASGTWRGFGNGTGEQNFGRTAPTSLIDRSLYDVRPNLDGTYTLFPIVLWDMVPAQQYGELDGVFEVTGFSQGAENTITQNGVKHLVVQNQFRNTKYDFFAIRMS